MPPGSSEGLLECAGEDEEEELPSSLGSSALT